MSGQTPVPWRVEAEKVGIHWLICAANRRVVAKVYRREDADRIAACVNKDRDEVDA